MGRFDGYLLISDMDGTLINPDTLGIDEKNVASIKEFMAEGGLFAFASGRTEGELVRYDELIRSNTYSICFNGSCLYNFRTGEKEYLCKLGDEIFPFLEWVEQIFPNVCIEITNDEINCLYRRNGGNDLQDRISGIPSKEFSDYRHFPGNRLKLSFWLATTEETDAFEAAVRAHGHTEGYDFMRSFGYCCEMMPKGANKGIALLRMRELLPNIKTVVAVGDAENDLLMLQNADMSFAPSNAWDSVKEVAGVVLVESCRESVLASVIEKLKNM